MIMTESAQNEFIDIQLIVLNDQSESELNQDQPNILVNSGIDFLRLLVITIITIVVICMILWLIFNSDRLLHLFFEKF
jgi:hypothetical protein